MTNLAKLPPLGLKTDRMANKAIRDFARGQQCAMNLPGCDGGGETTVHCHVRRFGYAGLGQKPHDFWGYHGCANCHANEHMAGDDDFLRAISITQIRLFEAGLLKTGG